jgi:hypothetical protein
VINATVGSYESGDSVVLVGIPGANPKVLANYNTTRPLSPIVYVKETG